MFVCFCFSQRTFFSCFMFCLTLIWFCFFFLSCFAFLNVFFFSICQRYVHFFGVFFSLFLVIKRGIFQKFVIIVCVLLSEDIIENERKDFLFVYVWKWMGFRANFYARFFDSFFSGSCECACIFFLVFFCIIEYRLYQHPLSWKDR